MVVFGNGALRAQYYILTLQRMFKSTSSGYRVDKLGYVSCIRPLKIFCRSLGHIGPVVLDKTLKYRKIIMQICLPIGKKQSGCKFYYLCASSPICVWLCARFHQITAEYLVFVVKTGVIIPQIRNSK